MSYRRYKTSIHLSCEMSIYLVYTRYIRCNLTSGDSVSSRVAIEMLLHTVSGLQGCLIFSTERGCATGHPLVRASPDPSGRNLQSRATDVRFSTNRRQGRHCAATAAAHSSGSRIKPPPPTTTWPMLCGSRGLLLTQGAE